MSKNILIDVSNIFFFSETQNFVIVDLICPNRDPDVPFVRETIGLKEKGVFFSNHNWKELVEKMNNCPHALAGKTIKAGTFGTNPYLYTDFDRSIVYNEKGQPLGLNTGVATTFASMFGFEVEFSLVRGVNYYDNKTRTWVGLTGDVSRPQFRT